MDDNQNVVVPTEETTEGAEVVVEGGESETPAVEAGAVADELAAEGVSVEDQA